jgi:hypothetical protein
MNGKTLLSFFIIIYLGSFNLIFSQASYNQSNSDKLMLDSLSARGLIMTSRDNKEIKLSNDQAIQFLQKSYQSNAWKNIRDPFRTAIGQVIFEASHNPFDSASNFLRKYPYDSIKVAWDEFYIWEPVRLRIPVINYPAKQADSIVKNDTVLISVKKDSIFPESLKASLQKQTIAHVYGLKDTTIMVIVDTLNQVTSSYPEFPFSFYRYPCQSDSIQAAVDVLLKFLEARDSSIINITGATDKSTRIWLNTKSDIMTRYWLNNDLNDSVTVWIGSPDRNTIGLYLEHGVIFRRPTIQGNISGARINVESLDKTTLQNIRKIVTKSQLWKTRTEAALALNQGMLTNWVKGGESSISTALDVTWYADYSNKPYLVSSGNFVRLKYGLIASGDQGIRTNIDLFETNSKLNHKAFGKFDFSGTMLFKTQVSKGYDYPNDSIPVSKFLNPAILTLGLGLDYKPNKETSINFSPLSYKGTFVPDTVMIDQTKYGIAADRKSKHEPGASILISNEFKPIKSISMTNRLQLFTNYINNPLNIDVDWEMILVAHLNWFTDVRLNTHLIFDDDTRTLKYNRHRDPVLGPDGIQKKTARIQFKEMLGLSLAFRF